MKAFLLSMCAMIAIGAFAYFGLEASDRSAQSVYSTSSVRH